MFVTWCDMYINLFIDVDINLYHLARNNFTKLVYIDCN
ncbi:hypothetical protein FLACHUCJ7_01191 [Flavobacterium chungangense]|uniref:Uncharacterized protein n=2 Tax=Flavobacterium TaxID=237 RepID=A0A6V6YU33_9FLAO|nr:hypothetical protein FLACHUCJ7_01191 [Flavobacterium chungangense]CAD0005462.1 hypothetical protein FLAT13_02773 [Flavobacterium salmonis]